MGGFLYHHYLGKTENTTNETGDHDPVTPSIPIAEICDAWSVAGRRNIWGSVPPVNQMQSEGGVAGAAVC